MKKMSAIFMTTTLALALTGCGKPLSELGKLADTLKQETSKESQEPEEFEEPQESEIIVNPEDTLIPTDSEVTNDLKAKNAEDIQVLPRNKDSESTTKSQETSEPDPDSIEDTYDVEGINDVTDPIAPDDPNHLWVLDGHLYTEDIRLSQYDGKVTLNLGTIVEPEGEHISKLTITQMGNTLAQTKLIFYVNNSDQTFTYNSIDEIGITDSNFDGYDDIIIIGETDRGREVSICEFEKASYEGGTDSLFSNDNFSEAIAEELGKNISVASVEELLYGSDFDGTFKDYSDAYKTAIAMDQLKYGKDADVKYDLVYFNDDDIPDLVIDHSGYQVSLYLFENGRLHCPINEWAYGAGGNAGYEFYEKSAAIENFNQDFAGAIFYYTYVMMDENYEMKETYGIKGYNFDDLNGNGTPDEDEITDEALLNAEGKIEYIDYTGENLSEDEIKEKIDDIEGTLKYLNGQLTYEELLREL